MLVHDGVCGMLVNNVEISFCSDCLIYIYIFFVGFNAILVDLRGICHLVIAYTF